ncbi:conserved hypothetical protein [Ricinus communis]|uniref:Uncharacterized protein n=1 Tax=Ricinus communis TaxID=3988 RepID=B9SY43_RICCO|nr:conserved hypothetical protein [Ricinus communis]
MGGGAAMRAAGKVAGIAAVNSGIRGGLSSVSSPAEQSVRNAKRPVSAIISSSSAQQNKVQKEGFQGPAFEVSDDWEIAGFEESEELQLIEPLPRLVFGGPPSLEEAKAATSEVKDALEKVYLSSPGLETTSCIISDARASSAPTHAIKAFTLLNRSPQAQTIVASIATDPNVWDAVLKNGALQEYLLSQNTKLSPYKC